MRPALADKVACIGLSQARVLESWGNADKTEVIGIPRLEPLRQKLQQQTALRTSRVNVVRLLVMTAKTPAFTNDQWQIVRESLVDLQHWLESTPVIDGKHVEVIWRLTGGLDSELGC